MPSWKAPDPDQIQAGAIKAVAAAMLELVYQLVNKIIKRR